MSSVSWSPYRYRFVSVSPLKMIWSESFLQSQSITFMYNTLIRNLRWDETRERKVSVVLAGGLVEPGGV